MDTTTSHILTKLDAIERAIGEMRREISVEAAKTTSEPKSASVFTRAPKFLGFLAGVSAKSAAQWATIALMVPYALKGGDISQLIKMLITLF